MKHLIENLKADWSNLNTGYRLNLSTVLLLLAATLFLVMPPVFLLEMPCRDVALRYAPMADAFANGNFAYAFHPRIPMLHPLLAGCVAYLTGCGGFFACKIISALFYTAGILPLIGLFQRIFTRRTVVISWIIYACASLLMQLGYSGLRDSAKSFLLLTLAYALVRVYQERNNWRGYLLLGFTCGISCLVRVDMIMLTVLAIFAMFFLECRRCRIAKWSWCGVVLAVMAALPAFIQNYLQIGNAVPDSYTALQVNKLLGRDAAVFEVALFIAVVMAIDYLSALFLSFFKRKYLLWIFAFASCVIVTVFIFWMKNQQFKWPDGVADYWRLLFYGSFAYYWILAFPGVAMRIYRKEWRVEEYLIAGFFLVHIAMVCLPFILFKNRFYVCERYLHSALPLLFGWAAYMTVIIWEFLDFTQKKWLYPRWCLRLTVFVVIAVPIGIYMAHSYKDALRDVLPGQQRQTLQTLQRIAGKIRNGNVVAADKKNCVINPRRYELPFATGMTYWEFRNKKWKKNRNPNVVIAYFAGAKLVKHRADYVLYVWEKSENPHKKIAKKHVLLYQTDDGEKIYQLWGMRR